MPETAEERAYRSDLLGVPVLASPSGPRLGRVQELLFSGPGGHLIGVLLMLGSRWRDTLVYPVEEIESIGRGAMLVRNARAILRTRRQDRLRRLLERQSLPLGKTLFNERGEPIGRVQDLAFSLKTGRILGYAVSRGLLLDLLEGRAFLPLSELPAWGAGSLLEEGGG